MLQRTRLTAQVLAVPLVSLLLVLSRPVAGAQAKLPERLTDAEFWQLVTDLSEPAGAFHQDNFTSNERAYADTAATLAAGRQGGAYIGVGPEQNFNYIAAMRPQIAFIVDIRRQMLMQHLLFMALFDLSKDRADYISNVEQYLWGQTVAKETDVNGGWRNFYENVSTLPIDAKSAFFRSPALNRAVVPCLMQGFLKAFSAGRVLTHAEAQRCPQ